MSSAQQEMNEQVFKSLTGDVALVSALNGSKVFDRVPERVSPPYIVMGQMSGTDWSTSTEGGEVVTFTLHTWSKTNSREESHNLQSHVRRILESGAVTLPGHHLISLRALFSEVRRARISARLHGVMRFRGVTEPK